MKSKNIFGFSAILLALQVISPNLSFADYSDEVKKARSYLQQQFCYRQVDKNNKYSYKSHKQKQYKECLDKISLLTKQKDTKESRKQVCDEIKAFQKKTFTTHKLNNNGEEIIETITGEDIVKKDIEDNPLLGMLYKHICNIDIAFDVKYNIGSVEYVDMLNEFEIYNNGCEGYYKYKMHKEDIKYCHYGALFPVSAVIDGMLISQFFEMQGVPFGQAFVLLALQTQQKTKLI